MDYRKLGATDLNVSLLGFGASPLGDCFEKIDPLEGTRAVHLAIDHGINFFDVSPYYGLTLAEERLGAALAGKRHSVLLATKCGRYGKAQFDFSGKQVLRSINESLRRLQTSYVDLLLAHDVEFGETRQILEETIPALRRVQSQGKARYIGISGYPLGTLVRILEAAPVDVVLSYCHYNLMATDMDDVLTPIARKRGIGLINAAGLHMGILTEHGPEEWHPAPEAVHAAGKEAAAHCHAAGVDVSELALRFCFNHPYVSSTLVGMATRRDVLANLRAFESPQRDELLAEVQKIIKPAFNLVWASGRPENND